MTSIPTDKVALFDLDSTLADYDLSMSEYMARLGIEWGGDRNNRTQEQEFARRLVQQIPGFWRNLPKYLPGFTLLNYALQIGFEPTILTKGPRFTPSAWTEKLEWCNVHVPEIPVEISMNKSRVYGRVLVDDWPEYFIPWLKVRPRGIVICPEHPWNKNVHDEWCGNDTRDRVFIYNGKNGQEIVHVLQKAFNR